MHMPKQVSWAEFREVEENLSPAEARARLGPMLGAIAAVDIQFKPEDIPPFWHSCSRRSKEGKTKFTIKSQNPDNPFRTEVCGCGGCRTVRRVVVRVDGQLVERHEPHGPWDARNEARRNKEHWTRTDAAENRRRRLEREQEAWERRNRPPQRRQPVRPAPPIVHSYGTEDPLEKQS